MASQDRPGSRRAHLIASFFEIVRPEAQVNRPVMAQQLDGSTSVASRSLP